MSNWSKWLGSSRSDWEFASSIPPKLNLLNFLSTVMGLVGLANGPNLMG